MNSRLPLTWFHARALWSEYLDESDRRGYLPTLDRWISQRFKASKKYGKRDRSQISDALFNWMRFAEWSEWITHEWDPSIPQRELWRRDEFLFAGARRSRSSAEFPPPSKAFLDFLSSEEARTRDRIEAGDPDAHARWHGFPREHWSALGARALESRWSNDDRRAWIEMQSRRPRLWVRVATELQSLDQEHLERASLVKEIEAHGLRITERAREGRAWALEGGRSLYEMDAFKSGRFEVQDLASQAIGESVPLKPGDRVWDACAGGGGKTIQLAQRLKGKGVVFASDVRAKKLEDLALRVRRTGLQNIRTAPWDGESAPQFGPEMRERKGFNCVLADVPCSSSGTWRRNPDLKFGKPLRTIEDFARLQLDILKRVSGYVLRGGTLVYSTCSWRVEENEAVVRAFTQGSDRFKIQEMRLLGAPHEDADTMFSCVLSCEGKS